MCAPVVVVGMMLASAAMAAKAQHDAGVMSQRLSRVNAAQAESAEADALARGEYEAAPIRERASAVIAAQQAGEASNNVDIQSGTAVQLASDVATAAARDIETVRNNARREAFGYHAQGINFLNEGRASRAAGDAAAMNSIIGGVAGAAGYGASSYFAARRATNPDGLPPGSGIITYEPGPRRGTGGDR